MFTMKVQLIKLIESRISKGIHLLMHLQTNLKHIYTEFKKMDMDRRSRTKSRKRKNRVIKGEDEKVLVPTDLIGRVIGKKGHKLREMERRTGAKIIVANDNVYVRGTPEQRQKARSKIQAIVDVSIDDIF